MSKLKTIFMGTPDFAVPSLEALKDKVDLIAVVTQPDRPKGRGHKLMPSPVKVWALDNSIPILQSEKIKTEEATEQLEQLKPDLIVVVAFGQILSKRILDLPKFGCINVHASLLPRYRGAAPIEWSLINGETKTGVTTMMMDVGLDTGDMLIKREVDITEDMILPELREKLMQLGAEALIETIDKLVEGTLERHKQDDSLSNYAPMLKKETGLIDWSKSAQDIHNLVRGLYGGAYTLIDGQKYKIWRTQIVDGKLEILEIQAPNSKKLPFADYLGGHKEFKLMY
ncbi:MAG: methionyl-tRNA formyltransferase [Selenomonadaceae bacterium]|nr:methionyl-tRNA formyltransferase [Selenomonadaceae bacterium]